ncbi:MAG: LamG domain-containing protein [Kiritimatiellae bacterium]|nr:LamG domain-containing protein [Kiritimatiellia bacterium]
MDLNFNTLSNGMYPDASSHAIRAMNVGGELCEGVDGYGLRLPGGPKYVNMELPEAYRTLEALTISVWVAPEATDYQEILVAPANDIRHDGLPFMLRRPSDWSFCFETRMADGERRILQAPPGIVKRISYPSRQWMHVTATCEGHTSCLYVDGKRVASTTFPSGKKKIERLSGTVKIGGHAGCYQGAVDNLRLYDRALPESEVRALFEEKAGFKPAAMAKAVAGTIDGRLYRGTSWLRLPLKRGALMLSNTGEAKFWGSAAPLNPANQWDLSYPLGLSGLGEGTTNFYARMDGNVEMRVDGSALFELKGQTKKGQRVAQRIAITSADEVKIRYEMEGQADSPPLRLTWPLHLYASAMRFTGHDERGLVTGNIVDLEGDLKLRGLNEFNLVLSDNRWVVELAPGTEWVIHGTRDPFQWRTGYTTFMSELEATEWNGWTGSPAVVELSVKLESDDLPGRLDRSQAREVTRPVAFDFSGVYARDTNRFSLYPSDRDDPIYVDDEAIVLTLNTAKPWAAQPVEYTWTLTNTLTMRGIASGEIKSYASVSAETRLTLPRLTAGAYRVDVVARTKDGSVADRCETELAIAGPIEQPVSRADQEMKLKKLDEVDFTAADPGHDFYSYSGQSKVVKGEKGSWRQTLTASGVLNYLASLGASRQWANDWFGARFRTEPGKCYVLEAEYPDLPFMSVSLYAIEPRGTPEDGACRPLMKTTSGVFTGSFLTNDNAMTTMRTVHFASAPWVAVCFQNAHNMMVGRDLDPACVKRVTLYEVDGDLPMLDAPARGDRLLGVHCESGGLSLSSFGVRKFRGELGEWFDKPDPQEYFRDAYDAVANLIRYMRYRGDTVLYYGIYRYRSAQFPSRAFPGGVEKDLPMLMARMFEKNGLKLVLTVMPHNTLPTARLQEFTHDDVRRGASGVAPVNHQGRQNLMHRCNPAVNPLHPQVRATYARLAAELGERYGRCPAVAGIAWMTGQSWWEPCLPANADVHGTAEENERQLLGAMCDDETMRQFAQWAKVTLPGKPDDPKRFQQRFEWIMGNAREAFKDFRCWGMAQTHKAFQEAFGKAAPDKDYIAMDFYQDLFVRQAEWPPVEACRLFGSGPKYYRDIPGIILAPYIPEANGCTHWEHANMSWKSMPKIQRFIRDDALAREWDTRGKSARYLHRQFYEQGLDLRDEPGLKWFWSPEVKRLGTISYPQQSGRGYLLDFLLLLARGTPDYISYMWCDSTIPMGHEREHREFAAAYRALPSGYYREADRSGEVFVRYLDGHQKAFYIVNTSAGTMRGTLKTGVSGVFINPLTGEQRKIRGARMTIDLLPYQLSVYVAK